MIKKIAYWRMKVYTIAFMFFIMNSGYSYANSLFSTDTIVVQLKWHHQFQFAGYYAALEKGFYKSAGLNVKFREGGANVNVYQSVISGKAQFAIGNSSILIERSKGLPLVVLGSIFQHSPSAIMVNESSHILTPSQLANKRIMFGVTEDVEILSMLQMEGIEISRIKRQVSTANPEDLLNGNTDAMVIYSTNEPLRMKNIGGKPFIINPLNYGIDFYGDCVFTSEDVINKNRKVVESFWAATIQGWEYAMENKSEISDLIIKKYSKSKDKATLLAEAEAMQNLIQNDLVEIGHTNTYRWKHIAEIYINQGRIKSNFSLQGLIYKPNEKVDLKQVFKWIGISLVIFMLIPITLGIYNYQLSAAVSKKTAIIAANEKILMQQNNELLEYNERILKINVELVESKKKVEATEKLKTAILANMSHEIRTPMNGIAGFSELLLQRDLSSEKQRQYTKIINHGCHQLLNIINDLVDISKLEAGQLYLNLTTVNLNKVVKESIEIYLNDAQLKNIPIRLIPDMKIPDKKFITDAHVLTTIINKILNNALKFTESGNITIGYYYKPDNIEVFITDTGIGILPEYHEQIFTPFWQVDQPHISNFGGTGLGLAITKLLIEKLKGTIWLKSELGKGSSFHFTLPYI